MKITKILYAVCLCLLPLFLLGQPLDNLKISHFKENGDTLITQLEQGMQVKEGQVSSLYNAYRNQGTQKETKEFLTRLLTIKNEAYSFNLLKELIEITAFSFSIDDILFLEKYNEYKKRIYDEYVSLQELNLSVARSKLFLRNYNHAKELFFEVFSVEYYKLRIEGKENQSKYSSILYPLQQEAYMGLLTIADIKSDKFLLEFLTSEHYEVFFKRDVKVLTKLNSSLKRVGLDTIPTPNYGRILIEERN